MTPLQNGGEMRRRQQQKGGRKVFREKGIGRVQAGEGKSFAPRSEWPGMGRRPLYGLLTGLVLAASVFAGQPKPKISGITLRAFHLLYPDYSQTLTVEMNQKFQLADTNLFVAVEDFVPHFGIDTVTHKVVSQSSELKNPAFKLAIYAGEEKKEEQWAFFKFAVPHFTRQTGLRFEVLKFTYNGKTYSREKSK